MTKAAETTCACPPGHTKECGIHGLDWWNGADISDVEGLPPPRCDCDHRRAEVRATRADQTVDPLPQSAGSWGSFDEASAGAPTEPPVMNHAEITALMASARTAKSRIAELELTAQMEHERVNTWLANAIETDRRHVAFVEAQAETFLRARIAADPKGPKSVTTPYGTISSRKQDPEYTRDDAVLLPWARDHGYLREPKPQADEIDWKRLKDALTIEADGSLSVEGVTVDGVTVEKRERSVRVEIDSR